MESNIQHCDDVNITEQHENQETRLKRIGGIFCNISVNIFLFFIIIRIMTDKKKSSSSSRGDIILDKISAGFALLNLIVGLALFFFLNILSVGRRAQICLIFVALISALAFVVIFAVNIFY